MIHNLTPYPHASGVVRSPEGRDELIVALKLVHRLTSGEGMADPGPDCLRLADVYFPSGALRYPADLTPARFGTDIVCHAQAYAPADRRATELRVSLRLGEVEQTVAIFGRRVWERRGDALVPSAPEELAPAPLPLGYEQAFGGPSFEANPIGRGFPAEEGAELPSVEDPSALLTTASDRPTPAGFGAVAPFWSPRRHRAGTYDDAWRRGRAPHWPADFDPRFFQTAAVVSRGFLRGGEPLVLAGLTPAGTLATRLPRPTVRALILGRWRRPDIAMLVLEPDEDRLEMTLRFSVDITGRLDRPPAIRLLERRVVTLGQDARRLAALQGRQELAARSRPSAMRTAP